MALSLCMQAQKIAFDAKYIKVGVVTNISLPQIENNANIRNLGQINYQNIYEKKVDGNIIADKLNQEKVGKIVLDRLLKRDSRGRLNMNSLYDEALNNTTLQETEVAMQDISAETKDVLKKEISYQLLKNNYIIIIQEIPKKKDPQKSKWYWQAFHVDIDDRIIQQVFLNWENPAIYDEINVPVSFVGEGRYYTDSFMFDLGKKVPAFAIRGSVFSRHPFLAYTTAQQGVKKVTDSLFIVSKKTERVKYIQKRYAPQGRLKLQVNIQDCTQSVENMLQKRGVMSLFKKTGITHLCLSWDNIVQEMTPV